MNFGSLFSGIEGIGKGLEKAGMTCAWQVDNDNHCLEVLDEMWPDVPKYKDVRDVGRHNLEPVDLICGGFPCQDVSVAGRRKGLAGKRSGLWFEFYRVLEELRPSWVLIENVRGLLSSNGGRDLATILRGLEKLGYHVAGRILDAQYFGVPQRRRRLFLVGSLGNYRCIEVLFESESLSWASPPSRRKGKISPTIPASGAGTSRTRNERTEAEMMVVVPPIMGAGPPSSRRDDEDSLVISNTLARGKRNNPENEIFIASPLRSRSSPNSNMPGRGGEDDENIILALHENQRAEIRMSEQAPELTTGGGKPGQGYPAILHQRVRRLTPLECERLQGFPDGWTENHSDTQRYRMLGNAVVPAVAEWIGRRIIEHDEIMRSMKDGR